LTEEEYILRLDDVANSLKCWGAVSHIRNSLAKSKERPRIGKVRLLCSSVISYVNRLGHLHTILAESPTSAKVYNRFISTKKNL
jgi:hypothetical protein